MLEVRGVKDPVCDQIWPVEPYYLASSAAHGSWSSACLGDSGTVQPTGVDEFDTPALRVRDKRNFTLKRAVLIAKSLTTYA